jgi:hypothetical protein
MNIMIVKKLAFKSTCCKSSTWLVCSRTKDPYLISVEYTKCDLSFFSCAADPCHFGMDPDPHLCLPDPAIFVSDLQGGN